MYEFNLETQTPTFLALRSNTMGIGARLDRDGELIQQASLEEIDRAIRFLVEDRGVDAIAINLLFSYTNPKVELDIARRIVELYPEIYVSRSSFIDPRVREFERLVVTALDAYIRPLVSRYVSTLREKLVEAGVSAKLFMMESHGGVIDASMLDDRAVSVLMSGLAGGVIGAAKVGQVLRKENLLSVDMGGTSTDVALISDGGIGMSDEGTVGEFDVRLPSVDVHTIGAGGGSIARVDRSGSLQVGPNSAGANPGPACYGNGGEYPTVTDANVVLGYLPTGTLADGTLRLSKDLAEAAILTHVADPTRISVPQAAWAVHQVAVASMANAARVVSIRRGIDVRDYALFPCGGAGPMHACDIADELGLSEVLIAPAPGVLAAYGLLAADTITNSWRTKVIHLAASPLAELHAEMLEGIEAALNETAAKGPDTARTTVEVTLGMRYVGQAHELDLPIEPAAIVDATAPQNLRKQFDDLHMSRYGQFDRESDCEIRGYKIAVVGHRDIPSPGFEPQVTNEIPDRSAAFYDPTRADFVHARVLKRSTLRDDVDGPAIIEQADSTIIIQRGWRASVLDHGSIHLVKVDASLSTMQ